MKKLSLLLVIFSLVPFLFARNASNASIMQNVEKALAMQHSSTAHNKGVIMVKLNVGAQVLEGADRVKDSSLEKDCPMVRISSHYLLGSYACVGLSDMGSFDHANASRAVERPVRRYISKATINGVDIFSDRIFESKENKIFLVQIDPRQEDLRNAIENKPTVNLFVPNDPEVLEDFFSSTLLNCGKNSCEPISIKDVCTEKGCFKVARAKHGKSGDPIFGLNPEKSTEEFLLGFNITDVERATRKGGKLYQFLTPEMINFIQEKIETVSPKDWAQIKRKTVNEDYF